jgi:ABC-type amino acid transport substrate-binding protein
MKPLPRVFLTILIVALVTSACGRNNDQPADDLPPTLAATATPVPFVAPGTTFIPETTQSALAAIRDRGVLRVGVLYNNPPFSLLTTGGQLEGFEPELVRAMGETWGVEVTFVQVTRQTGIPHLLNGNVDMLAATVPHRRESHELVDFSQAVFRSGYLMLVPDDSSIEGIADLDGQAVGIVEAASFDVIGERARDEGVTPTAQQFGSTSEAVDALLEGEVSAVVARREALMLATQNHPELTMRSEFLLLEPYAFAIRRGDANFRNLIDVTFQGLLSGGVYAELFNEHFYGYASDDVVLWPGEAAPAFGSQPATLEIPVESKVASVVRGETIAVAGLDSSYDDPELDGQRLVDDFNRAIINEIAQRWDVSVDEVSGGAESVASGEADMAVDLVPRRDLAQGVDYSQTYLQFGMRLARPGEVAVQGIDDLDAHPIAVLGSPADAELITSRNTGVELVEVTSSRHALSLLEAEAASVVLADEFTIGLIAREDPTIVILEGVYRPLPHVIAVPRYDSDFRALVNFTLQDIYADGTLARLVRQYFGPYAPEDDPAQPYPVEVWPGSADYLGLPS